MKDVLNKRNKQKIHIEKVKKQEKERMEVIEGRERERENDGRKKREDVME